MFYVTFGQKHRQELHPVLGSIYGFKVPDGWVEIQTDDEEIARTVAFDVFGDAWSMLYSEEQWNSHGDPRRFFPLGCMTDEPFSPQAKVDLIGQFSREVQDKADKLLSMKGSVQQDSDFAGAWNVKSLRPEVTKIYRVYVAEDQSWATCTCVHGHNNQGRARCYHACSVLKSLQEQ